MRRLACLTAFSMMALFVFAPAAVAQEVEEELVEEVVEIEPAEPPPPPKAAPPPPPKAAPPPPPKAAKETPKTGGMSVGSALLPAAGLLLVGSGVIVLAALRRR